MSACSPYIRQAVERCKLPIFVAYLGYLDEFLVLSRSDVALPEQCWIKEPAGATRAYSAAVKELTK